MFKFFVVFVIIALIFITTIVKNSTKKIDEEIFATKERIGELKNKGEMLKLEYDFLSSPEKILEYQKNYFENELSEIDISLLGVIELSEKLKIIEQKNKFINE